MEGHQTKTFLTKTLFSVLVLLLVCAPFFVNAQETVTPPSTQTPNAPSVASEAIRTAACASILILTDPTCLPRLSLAKEAVEQVAGGVAAHAGLLLILAPVAVISFVILAFSSFLLWLAGILFNWSLAYLVFNFGVYFGNSTGLLLAWGILRDFGNIILLFGFVYMGIQTILNIGNYDTGKTLSRLVIFAVLLNFSLFISEAIIDTANGLTTTLYSQTSTCDITDTDCLINHGIASEILDRASIMSALGFGGASNLSSRNLSGADSRAEGDLQFAEGSNYFTNPIGETLKFLGLALLVTTAAVVLIAGALMLISRAIHLTFLMVVSPIGFAGMAVPWLEKMAKDWWDALVKQALFAPVFLLLLFVSLKLLDGLDGLAGGEGGIASAIQSTNAIDTGPIVFFALVIGFMIASLLVAKKFGIYGAEAITKTATGLIGRTAGAATFGAMGWMGRNTIGSASNVIARNLGRVGRIPLVGRQLRAVVDAGAKASFDARSVLKTGAELGEVSKAAKGGRRGVLEATKKAEEEYAKTMSDDDKNKYNLLKSEKDRLRDKIDAELGTYGEKEAAVVAAAAGTRFAPMVAKMQAVGRELDAKMINTVEGKRQKESQKKEDLDENVKNWNENRSRLETITSKLVSIDKDLTSGRVTDPALITALQQQKIDLGNEQRDISTQQRVIQTDVLSLRDDIIELRKQIKKEQSQYRRNLHEVATHLQVGGFSPIDRMALREAVVGIKKNKDIESELKPKKIDEALGRKLRNALGIPHP